MKDNKVQIKEGNAVPIVITEKTVRKAPETVRRTSYLGVKAGLNNLYYKIKGNIASIIHDSFFDESIEVIDPGVINEVHYVIQVGGNEYEPQLTVEKTSYKPPCATHYEIIKIRAEDSDAPEEKANDSEMPYGAGSRPIPRRIIRSPVLEPQDINNDMTPPAFNRQN